MSESKQPSSWLTRAMVAAAVAVTVFVVVWRSGARPDWVPQLAAVTGTVTLDGKPLAGALVMFEGPQGQASVGATDEEGRYSLSFFEFPGAPLGENVVRISNDVVGPPPPGYRKVPQKFNTRTTLKVEVENKPNTFDFDLVTKR